MKTDHCGKIRRWSLVGVLCCAALTPGSVVSGGEPTSSPPSSPPYLLVFRVSEQVLQSHVNSTIDENSRIDEVILGTQVDGQARVQGSVKIDLIEDRDHGKFLITFTGTAAGRSVGTNGPAVIHSNSQSSFIATKRVIFEPGEGFYMQPAQVRANTAVQNAGIDSTRGGIAGRIVRRVAAGEVAAKAEPGRQIAEQIAARKIEAAFSSQVAERLADLNRAVQQRTKLVQQSQLGRNVRIHAASTDDGVLIGVRLADVPYTPIELPPYDHSSQGELWVHESLLDDDLAAMFTNLKSALVENRQVLVSTIGGDVAQMSGHNFDRFLRPPGGMRSARVGQWMVVQPARKGSIASPSDLVVQRPASAYRTTR